MTIRRKRVNRGEGHTEEYERVSWGRVADEIAQCFHLSPSDSHWYAWEGTVVMHMPYARRTIFASEGQSAVLLFTSSSVIKVISSFL